MSLMPLEARMLPFPELVGRQNSHFPCPNGNGTRFGDIQEFELFCGTDIDGIEIDRLPVDSLSTCVSVCTSHQNPRCDGVTFRQDKVCIFKSSLRRDRVQATSGAESAIGLLADPEPSSRCKSLGTGTLKLIRDKRFDLQCNQIFPGNDIAQEFHATFDECLEACADQAGCGGVSFDIKQSNGFNNCYLKTSVNTGGLLQKSDIDSAIIRSGEESDGSGAMNPGAGTGSGEGAGVLSSSARPAAMPSSSMVQMDELIASTTASTMATTSTTPIPSLQQGTITAIATATQSPEPQDESDTPSSSNAWIAAPVIGGLAAVALIMSMFILWGRRRRGQALPFGMGDNNFTRKLPRGRGLFFGGEKLGDIEEVRGGSAVSAVAAARGKDPVGGALHGRNGSGERFKVISGSGRRIGHESSTVGTGPGLDGMFVGQGYGIAVSSGGGGGSGRGAVGKGAGDSGRPDSESKAGLRDSQNGLRLNGVSSGGFIGSVPGIPDGFSGPKN